MPYPILDIEVTQPLPNLKISEEDTGIALVLRRKDKAVGLIMQPLAPNSVLSPEDLAKMIEREVGIKLLQEAIREELTPAQNGDRFPSLTVAICTKDRPENLARCLQHLLKLQTPIAGEKLYFEVLVIDNAPSDERTKELVDSLPGVRYAREQKPGLDFARNRALQEATGELLAFLDDDVTPDRQWLNGLMEAWAENPDAGGFTGLVLPYELVTEAQILFESRGGFRRGFEKIRYGQILPYNPLYPCGAGIFGAGCNMAFRRDVLLKLGGFDDALDTGAPLPGGGDLDIFYRVVRAGYLLVYEPRYLVFHQHRREYEKLRHQYWTWGLGFMAFVVKSYQTDPSQRSKLCWLVGWWFADQLNQLQKSVRGCHVLPPTMILAELWGGVVGLFGEYPRSLKRIEKMRQKFA
ncbi:glycosyltransferase family 2 protein [Microcoleus asticus]|uniref:Mycofactocin biosynthesis glycosyltransferase MftF n=1 Tax=Microcoleus asticus IPMA8 TaxID=2563858 RepID=A0ABX2CSI0_9CYAN|nr:glycosyltransferase [Microcoleus asticus]NQE33171.1 putative mycofactocin biosynthesis glycosyltransferase MftF [Microcoleus asticus IPMA8]